MDRKDQGTESIKGFWYKLDSNTIMLNYRAYRDDPDSPTNLNPILSWKLTVDRGDLFDTRNGNRWKRIKEKLNLLLISPNLYYLHARISYR